MKLVAGSRSDVGNTRGVNEDCVHADERVGLFIVADGLGGHQAGEKASQLAAQTLSANLGRLRGSSAAEVDREIAAALEKTHRAILYFANARPEKRGMGSTVVLAVFRDTRVHVAHIGDSRAYLYRRGQIEQLTQDHSLVNNLVKTGQITAGQARAHPLRAVITQSLGSDQEPTPDLMTVTVEVGDRYVLCTDGVSDWLGENALRSVLSQPASPDEQCQQLIEAALEAGSHDNLSAIVVAVEE